MAIAEPEKLLRQRIDLDLLRALEKFETILGKPEREYNYEEMAAWGTAVLALCAAGTYVQGREEI